MTNFTIAITSDNVCPWCYVGAKKLSAGIALYKSRHPTNNNTTDTFTTSWLPYQLNPHAPSPGVSKREYYISRFGAEKVALMFPRLEQIGKTVGIEFKFGGMTGNTRDSHRLVHMAKEKKGVDTQNQVVEALMKSYFENEGDITDHATLTAAAVGCGLDEREVREWLKSDAGGKEVDREVLMAQRRGVSGVPNFVIQGKYEIGGAQDAEAFVQVFEKIKEIEGR